MSTLEIILYAIISLITIIIVVNTIKKIVKIQKMKKMGYSKEEIQKALQKRKENEE